MAYARGTSVMPWARRVLAAAIAMPRPDTADDFREPVQGAPIDAVMTSSATRRVGRPQSISDDAIFRATYRVMAERGPAHLTLAAIAEVLGHSAPALLKRFGTKRNLLLAFVRWLVGNNSTQFTEARRTHVSPLAALRVCLLMTESPGVEMTIDPRGYANTLQFYFQEVTDPEFHAIWTDWIREYEKAIIDLLADAVAAGEILPDCDVVGVGQTLHAALTGVGVLWAGDDRRSMAARLREAFDTIISPFLPPQGSAPSDSVPPIAAGADR